MAESENLNPNRGKGRSNGTIRVAPDQLLSLSPGMKGVTSIQAKLKGMKDFPTDFMSPQFYDDTDSDRDAHGAKEKVRACVLSDGECEGGPFRQHQLFQRELLPLAAGKLLLSAATSATSSSAHHHYDETSSLSSQGSASSSPLKRCHSRITKKERSGLVATHSKGGAKSQRSNKATATKRPLAIHHTNLPAKPLKAPRRGTSSSRSVAANAFRFAGSSDDSDA